MNMTMTKISSIVVQIELICDFYLRNVNKVIHYHINSVISPNCTGFQFHKDRTTLISYTKNKGLKSILINVTSYMKNVFRPYSIEVYKCVKVNSIYMYTSKVTCRNLLGMHGKINEVLL